MTDIIALAGFTLSLVVTGLVVPKMIEKALAKDRAKEDEFDKWFDSKF